MPDDIEKINEIFRIHDENAKKKTGQTGRTGAQPAAKPQEHISLVSLIYIYELTRLVVFT